MTELNLEDNAHHAPTNDEDQDKRNKKTNFQKYAESNSVGGLSYVLTSKSKARRFIWLVIILVCVAISLYMLRKSFSKLVNRPTSTSITIDTEMSIDFPAVTICNVNAFSAEKLSGYGIDSQLFRDIYRDYNVTHLERLDAWNNVTLGELVNTYTNSIISYCSFGGYECDIHKDFDFVLKDLHACFTFNSGRRRPILKANGTGVNRGLYFHFNIHEYDYTESFLGDAGIRIVVHPQHEPPHPDRIGVAASPETYMYISLKKHIFDDQTQRECLTKDQNKWMHLSEEFSRYSFASCLEDSSTNRSISECGCVLSTHYLSSDRYNVCNLAKLFCYRDSYFDEPLEPCRPACERTTFEIISATHTKYPADYPYGIENDGVVVVSVFYETPYVQTQTTAYSYGVEEFFAEVGGQLGLFIGVSVITLFEFGIFLLDEIKNWIKQHSKIERFQNWLWIKVRS